MTVLCKRGRRDYVLGADILEAIHNKIDVPSNAPCDFIVTRKCHKNISIVESSSGLAPELIVATYKDKEHKFWVIESESEVTQQKPDDEAFAANFFVNEGLNVVIPTCPQGFTVARLAVVAFKAALKAAGISSSTRFLLGRLVLKFSLDIPFSIRYSRLVNGKFYEGILSSRSQDVGRIYFSEAE